MVRRCVQVSAWMFLRERGLFKRGCWCVSARARVCILLTNACVRKSVRVRVRVRAHATDLIRVFGEFGFDGAFGDAFFKFPLKVGEFEEAGLMSFLKSASRRRRSGFLRPRDQRLLRRHEEYPILEKEEKDIRRVTSSESFNRRSVYIV